MGTVPPEGLPKAGEVMGGKYRLERLLGVGGMGAVYEAKHELMEQRVAVKLLLPTVAGNEEAVARFKNEATALRRLECEHVVRVMDVGTQPNGAPFIVMDLLSGVDLRQVLTERGPLPVTEAVDYLLQALVALAEAHAVGIVHRDLKPSNLFLSHRAGRAPVVKVVDFGVSKISNDDEQSVHLTTTRALLGSPLYMSPEQIRKSKATEPRSDLWSFGVVAYELLAGKPPFDGDNMGEVFAMILETTPRRLDLLRPDVPTELADAIHRCLERDPERRFQDAADVARALCPYGSNVSQLAVTQILQRSSPQFLMVARDTRPTPTGPLALPPPTGPAVTGGSWSTTTPPRARSAAFAIIGFAALVTASFVVFLAIRFFAKTDAREARPMGSSVVASAPPPEASSVATPTTDPVGTVSPLPAPAPVPTSTATTSPQALTKPPPGPTKSPPSPPSSAKPPASVSTATNPDIFGRH